MSNAAQTGSSTYTYDWKKLNVVVRVSVNVVCKSQTENKIADCKTNDQDAGNLISEEEKSNDGGNQESDSCRMSTQFEPPQPKNHFRQQMNHKAGRYLPAHEPSKSNPISIIYHHRQKTYATKNYQWPIDDFSPASLFMK